MPVRQRGKDSYQVDVTHDGKRFRESFNGTKSNADIISAVVLDCMKHNKDIKNIYINFLLYYYISHIFIMV